MLGQMTEYLLPNRRVAMRAAPAPARRLDDVDLSTTIALVVLFAVAVIAIAIGIAQADALQDMVDDESGRLALCGLILGIVMIGAITAAIMWVTAPAAETAKVRAGLASERALALARARFPRR